MQQMRCKQKVMFRRSRGETPEKIIDEDKCTDGVL